MKEISGQYSTVLSQLNIPDPVVFNTVVDQCAPESIILIQNKQEMNRYMRDEVDEIGENSEVIHTKAWPLSF